MLIQLKILLFSGLKDLEEKFNVVGIISLVGWLFFVQSRGKLKTFKNCS